jgi:ribulose-phosphate 3-epimerase
MIVAIETIPTGQIAPSLLSADFARLGESIELVMDAGANVMHVDVMDGKFVPPITIGSLIVDAIRDLVKERGGVIDCHLMVERPERQVEMFAKAGADIITIHPEATPHIHYALQTIRAAGCKAGVVINPGSPVELVEPVADIIDMCLVMSVNPGWGGQKYIPSSTERIRRLRSLLPDDVVIEIDGGVSLDTVDEIRDAGAQLFVAGSAVFNAADPQAAFKALAARVA